MKRPAALFLASLLLALPGSAQDTCSSLSITAEVNPLRPVQTVTVQFDGSSASDLVYLVAGPTLGETTLNLRTLGVLVLDLDRPFTTMLLGTADSNGDLTKTYKLPSDLGLELNAEAVGFAISPNAGGKPTARFCKSNVVTFEL